VSKFLSRVGINYVSITRHLLDTRKQSNVTLIYCIILSLDFIIASRDKLCLYLLSTFQCLNCLLFQSLVSKPDQLIKRRGKLGLLKVKTNLNEAKEWIGETMGKDQQVRKYTIYQLSIFAQRALTIFW
jgi:hypothetical protein